MKTTQGMNLFIGVILVLLVSGNSFGQGAVSDANEKQALLDLYNATSGSGPWTRPWNVALLQDPTSVIANFTTVDPPPPPVTIPPTPPTYADLLGVTIQNGDVVGITLGNVRAIGSIPASINLLTGLKTLVINSHSTTSSTPNAISGVLPNLNALTSLQTLSLSANDCTGLVDWLGTNGSGGSLSSLNVSSYIGSERLVIKPTPAFANLTSLTTVDLSGNSFSTLSGSVNNIIGDDIELLDAVTNLNLSNCNLNANSFSSHFSGMANVSTLTLSSNTIINVPAVIGDLPSLITLYLNTVGLQSFAPTFDSGTLTTLYLEYNNLTNNQQLKDIMGVLKNSTALVNLYLSHNILGELPDNFKDITSLRFLDLSYNSPLATSDLVNIVGSPITSLRMQYCGFTTHLPSYLINLAALATLDLSNDVNYATTNPNNRINLNATGAGVNVADVLANIIPLKTLRMEWYSIAGPATLPLWFGTGKMNEYENLYLDHNQIQLPFLANFYAMAKLKILDMSTNALSGALSVDFNCTAFPQIVNINLSDNQLSSISPQNPLPDWSSCATLQTLDISSNDFSGELPAYFATGVPVLTSLNISKNRFDKISALQNRSNATSLTLNASYNYFDFEDLSQFYNSSCSRLLGPITYSPQIQQAVKGESKTFKTPEGLSLTIDFIAPGVNNYYQWQYFGSSWTTVTGVPSYPNTNDHYTISSASPSNTGTYRTLIRNHCMPGFSIVTTSYAFTGVDYFIGNNVLAILLPPLCGSEIPNKPGTFKLDKLTGTIVFERSDCTSKVPVSCVFTLSSSLDNVVAAKATTHDDHWSYEYLKPATTGNPFEAAERGKWRSKGSYAYNTTLVQANDKNYNGGTFKYRPFNWKYGTKSFYPGWLKLNEVQKYSPNGEVVEERNALNIASTAKFGYAETVPYLVAQNADYGAVLFESFEVVYGGTKLEDGLTINGGSIDQATAHSGNASFKLQGITSVNLRTLAITDQIKFNGLQARIWVKGDISNSLQLQFTNYMNAEVASAQFIWVANSGEWGLYEANITPAVFVALSETSVNMKLKHTAGITLWVDDLRIQPKDSEMTAYVYDRATLRLLTVFDDQHFGMFYQYNAEGRLVRKLVETERGVKTIQETQYNSKKTSK
jgi:Leucine-rich repeat (LRR) protein